MSVDDAMQPTTEERPTTEILLPADITRPFEVFLNGVHQAEGRDFTVKGDRLVFDRELKREGRLGVWRWASIFVGVAGTYRQNDSVDVVYTRAGKRVVAASRPIVPPD